MQRSGHSQACAAASILSHTHCFDDQQPVVKSQRSHLHRSRSKTVSTGPCDCNTYKTHVRLDLATMSTNANTRNSKRKTSQIRGCSQHVCATQMPLEMSDRRGANEHSFTDIDLINGNVLDNSPCTNSTTITPRLMCRNRIRTTTTTATTSGATAAGKCSYKANATAANTLMKRGKRTLSSTQIEREKSDEKNIKLLRSLSPILVASNARSSIKKIISPSTTK